MIIAVTLALLSAFTNSSQHTKYGLYFLLSIKHLWLVTLGNMHMTHILHVQVPVHHNNVLASGTKLPEWKYIHTNLTLTSAPLLLTPKHVENLKKHYFSLLDDFSPFLQVVLCSPTARLPIRSLPQAASHNLSALQDQLIPAHGKALIDIGISFTVPSGTYGCIAPQSSLTTKHMIDVSVGVIDEDYTGSVKVLLFNHGDSDFHIQAGDCIAQLILECISISTVLQVNSLDNTTCASLGFGSTRR